MILSSAKDAAGIKFGDQFTVNIPEMDPIGEDETADAFDKRFVVGLEKRDAIFAAVDEALKPEPTLLELILAFEGDDFKTLARDPRVRAADVKALAIELGIKPTNEVENLEAIYKQESARFAARKAEFA